MLGQRIAKRYEILELIGQGGMGIVYKAHDRLMTQAVALKSVLLNRNEPTGSTTGESTIDFRVNIAQEFRTLASLRHPHIVGVLDYGFDNANNPFITMELLDTSSNILRYCKTKSFDEKLQAFAEMLQALAYLHRRNIIHRDLKPDNVSVIGKTVKVLDFGLAAAREHLKKEQEEDGETLRGTLAYMPPEILDGRLPNEGTDLYALGLIAFEMFSGSYPFNTKTINTLIQDIIQVMPDVDILDVPDNLRQVIHRLVIKDPGARYSDANDVLNDIQELLGKQSQQNSVQIRESYLQAAEFVGREKELNQLQSALQKVKEGIGDVWLLSGEAGVGKSRVVEEFRIQALVKGMTVLRGQAASEQAQSYQLWRDPLRRYMLSIEPDARTASVLKTLIPDLATLLDMPLTDAPSLDPQANHQRLLATIEELFLNAPEPVVIVLEDLHWADSESLELLARFERIVRKAPVLLVASLRDDESDVSQQLPPFNKLHLSRFDQKEIQALSASMIGQAGNSKEVVQLLQRETEGNAFFLVEVVRTLAEEAGDFKSIGFMTLPQAIFAGGVQRIVENRLRKVPEAAMAVLRLAAIHGRVLDLKMLEKVFGSALNDLLLVSSEASVLDVIDDKWRFAHDKLRDGILTRLSDEEKITLHQEAAEALEAAYPNDASQAVNLANHWNKAGNSQKEYRYVVVAGEQAIQEGANRNAVNYLLRAKEIQPGNTSDTDKARIERNLGSAYYGLGQFKKLREHHGAALDLMGWALPKSTGGYILGILRHIGEQIAHRWFEKAFFGSRKQYQDTIRNVCEIHYELISAYGFENVLLPGMYSTLYTLNMAENAAIYGETSYGYAQMTYILNMLRMRGAADGYRKMTQEMANRDANYLYSGVAYNVLSGYALTLGRWDLGLEMAEASMKIYSAYRHERRIGEVSTSIINYHLNIGNYDAAQKATQELRDRAMKINDAQAAAAALALQMLILLRRNQIDEALLLVRDLQEQLLHQVGSATEILAYGILGLLYQRVGEREKSREAVQASLKAMTGTQPVVFYMLDGIANTVEAALGLLQDASASEKATLEGLVKGTLKYLGDFAAFFPFGRPQLYLWQGVHAKLKGDQKKALDSWQKALDSATKLVMPYDEALIQYTIANSLDSSSPEYQHRMNRASQVFKKLGVNYYLEQLS